MLQSKHDLIDPNIQLRELRIVSEVDSMKNDFSNACKLGFYSLFSVTVNLAYHF